MRSNRPNNEKVNKTMALKQAVKEALPYFPDNTGPIPCPSPQITHWNVFVPALHTSVFTGAFVVGALGAGVA